MSTHTGRELVKVSISGRGDDTWDARIEYRDDNSEDRQGGFDCRAAAHGWAQSRIDHHFRLGVPGRLGAGG